jgi:polysaccharide export outer membrane protein
MLHAARALIGLSCIVALTACTLPRGAALRSEVLRAADSENADFAVYPVTRALLPALATWPQVNEPHLGWITTSGGSRAQVIAAGDTLRLTIWDSSENSLLTTLGQRQVEIPPTRVGPTGDIFVPYVGDVPVAGLSPDRARERVQDRLAQIAGSAQVQLALEEGRSNSVDLVGGVAAPGIYPLPDRAFTVLSLLSAGGGVAPGLQNPQIRLLRGGQIYGTSIDRLYAEPRLDTLLRAGDQVVVEEDDRYFLSVGAAGQEAQHDFPQDVVTALDAVAIIGGVLDSRANPQGVLILRDYPASALAAGLRGPRRQRVVFGLDLTSADGLFSAGDFRIAPGDLVYVTESPVTTTQTIFGLVGQAFGLQARLTN